MKKSEIVILIGILILINLSFGSVATADGFNSGVLSDVKHLLKIKQPKTAEILLSKHINQNKTNAALIYSRAKIRADYLKDDNGALTDYTLTIKYAGQSFPKAYWRRGDILAKQDMLHLAIKDYSYCLRLLPKYGKVYFKRAQAYQRLGMLKEATLDLQRCVHYSPVYKNAVLQYRKNNNL